MMIRSSHKLQSQRRSLTLMLEGLALELPIVCEQNVLLRDKTATAPPLDGKDRKSVV